MRPVQSFLSSRYAAFVPGCIVAVLFAGLFLAVMTGTPATFVLVQDEPVSLTVTVDKGIAFSGQCMNISWNAVESIAVLKQPHTPTDGASQGTALACYPEEAEFTLPAYSHSTYKPAIYWINPFNMLAVALTAFVLTLLLRRPAWLASGHRDLYTLIAALAFAGAIAALLATDNRISYQFNLIGLLVGIAGTGLAWLLRRSPYNAFRLICLTFIVLIMAISAYKLMTVPVINEDEVYYLSMAATANGGYGLYPALQNYPPMPLMGGIGYFTWTYVFAYQVFGPSIYSLRLVVLLVYYLSFPAIFWLFRRLYGSVTGWLAVALIPAAYLPASVLSTRMDAFPVTCIWWGLLLVVIAREKDKPLWHIAAGLWLGLSLEAHIHTSVTTIAVGLLYLFDYARQVWQAKRLILPKAVMAYSVGALLGLGIYFAVNVLPNADSYFRTAGNAARFSVVSASLSMSLPERLLRSLTALDVFLPNFRERIASVVRLLHPVELLLWGAAFVALGRNLRQKHAQMALVLSIGVLAAGFFILNNSAILYTAHISAALLLCLPPFLTPGFQQAALFERRDVSPAFVLVVAGCLLPFFVLQVTMISAYPMKTFDYPETVQFVRANIPRDCVIAGPHAMFLSDFAMYPRYNSSELSLLGMRYYNYDTPAQLWNTIAPDILIAPPDGVEDSLKFWAYDMKYEEIAPNVLKKTYEPLSPGCIIGQGVD